MSWPHKFFFFNLARLGRELSALYFCSAINSLAVLAPFLRSELEEGD